MIEYIVFGLFVAVTVYASHLRDKDYSKRLMCILNYADHPLSARDLHPLVGGSYGQLYGRLDRLETEGVVRSEKREIFGERPKLYFSLTKKGEEEVREMI